MKKKKKKRKEEGIQGERRKERRKERKMSSAGFKPVRLVLLVFLSVEQDGVVGRIGFSFLPS